VSRVLVVDDEAALREAVAVLLRDEGYAVLTATDGRAALSVLATEAPDLVLMDVMMPGMDGREAYLAMRAHPNGRAIPIVLSSAAADPAGLDPSISGFLPKPFDIDELLQLVARLLADGSG
jgi:CheY-like chemotaxis protein